MLHHGGDLVNKIVDVIGQATEEEDFAENGIDICDALSSEAFCPADAEMIAHLRARGIF